VVFFFFPHIQVESGGTGQGEVGHFPDDRDRSMDGYEAAAGNELDPATGSVGVQIIHALTDGLCHLLGQPSVFAVLKKHTVNRKRRVLYVIKLYIIYVQGSLDFKISVNL
jgi:hypothetical protein